jgi:hypothetical protein
MLSLLWNRKSPTSAVFDDHRAVCCVRRVGLADPQPGLTVKSEARNDTPTQST